MAELTRRDVLKIGAQLAALMGITTLAPRITEAVDELAAGNVPVLWIQAQSCSGCTVSMLNSDQPGPAQILTQMISLRFNATLATATGHQAMAVIHKTVEEGGYYLVVEGSIPVGMPKACLIGEEPATEQIEKAAARAKAIIALGTCAAYGGIPAAEGNPTGAKSLPAFLAERDIRKPMIVIPGCPSHPDWLVGTLAHLIKVGMPELDAEHRPTMFFGQTIHEKCPRLREYKLGRYARSFAESGCLLRLGCVGPDTYADCTKRFWNSGVNHCVKAGAPCIGCAAAPFSIKKTPGLMPKEEPAKKAGAVPEGAAR